MRLKELKSSPKPSKLAPETPKKGPQSMTNEVWKPSWSDLWAKLEPGQTHAKENLDLWLHFGGQNPLKINIFGHRFLDAFLNGILMVLGCFWTSFWRCLGGQMDAKMEKAET